MKAGWEVFVFVFALVFEAVTIGVYGFTGYAIAVDAPGWWLVPGVAFFLIRATTNTARALVEADHA